MNDTKWILVNGVDPFAGNRRIGLLSVDISPAKKRLVLSTKPFISGFSNQSYAFKRAHVYDAREITLEVQVYENTIRSSDKAVKLLDDLIIELLDDLQIETYRKPGYIWTGISTTKEVELDPDFENAQVITYTIMVQPFAKKIVEEITWDDMHISEQPYFSPLQYVTIAGEQYKLWLPKETPVYIKVTNAPGGITLLINNEAISFADGEMWYDALPLVAGLNYFQWDKSGADIQIKYYKEEL